MVTPVASVNGAVLMKAKPRLPTPALSLLIKDTAFPINALILRNLALAQTVILEPRLITQNVRIRAA
jgi:hypothetical protein